jgi:hypothetical protein
VVALVATACTSHPATRQQRLDASSCAGLQGDYTSQEDTGMFAHVRIDPLSVSMEAGVSDHYAPIMAEGPWRCDQTGQVRFEFVDDNGTPAGGSFGPALDGSGFELSIEELGPPGPGGGNLNLRRNYDSYRLSKDR